MLLGPCSCDAFCAGACIAFHGRMSGALWDCADECSCVSECLGLPGLCVWLCVCVCVCVCVCGCVWLCVCACACAHV